GQEVRPSYFAKNTQKREKTALTTFPEVAIMCENPPPPKYDNTPCDGCYLHNVRVIDKKTGEDWTPVCKSYKCEKHGWIHTKRLEQAPENYLKTFKHVRFWTFTLSSRNFDNPVTHARALSKVWRYFITEMRRSKLLTPAERNIQ